MAESYLGPDGRSLRRTTQHQGMAICYATQEKSFSHTTLWRFLGYLGSMTVSLAKGVELLLQSDPESTVHRFVGLVSPSKYRTARTRRSLADCAMFAASIEFMGSSVPRNTILPTLRNEDSPTLT